MQCSRPKSGSSIELARPASATARAARLREGRPTRPAALLSSSHTRTAVRRVCRDRVSSHNHDGTDQGESRGYAVAPEAWHGHVETLFSLTSWSSSPWLEWAHATTPARCRGAVGRGSARACALELALELAVDTSPTRRGGHAALGRAGACTARRTGGGCSARGSLIRQPLAVPFAFSLALLPLPIATPPSRAPTLGRQRTLPPARTSRVTPISSRPPSTTASRAQPAGATASTPWPDRPPPPCGARLSPHRHCVLGRLE